MAKTPHPKRLITRLRRAVLHVFGLGEHGLVDLFQHRHHHRAGLAGATFFALLHIAAGSHDTLSLLGLLDLKPEVHVMGSVEAMLTMLVWLGHLLGDDWGPPG